VSQGNLLGLDYDLQEIRVGSKVVVIGESMPPGNVVGAGKGDSILVSFPHIPTPVLVIEDDLAVLTTEAAWPR